MKGGRCSPSQLHPQAETKNTGIPEIVLHDIHWGKTSPEDVLVQKNKEVVLSVSTRTPGEKNLDLKWSQAVGLCCPC